MLVLPITLLCLILGMNSAVTAAAEQEPLPPVDSPILIRNINVWDTTGEIRPNMSILVRDGFDVDFLSDTVSASDYPQARIIEAEADWIVYPGLIHADFPNGRGERATNPYRGTATDPTTGPMPAMEYGDHRSFFAWLHVSDKAQWDADSVNGWRDLGFTSAYLLPSRGLVQGYAAQVALNGKPLAEALLQREGFQVLSLRAVGGYPQTAMAALAVHRQLFLDQGRPELSPDLVLGNKRIFRANGARSIENFLDLQRDFDNSNAEWLILGGYEAWHHAERLRAQGIGVLYSLNFEEAPKSEEDLEADDGDARPWWQFPLLQREELRREHAERVAEFLKLREAGVPCALVPQISTADFGERMQQLIDAGLDKNLAYQALSTDLVQLLDLDKRPGDFVISRGAFNFEDPQLAWVFSHGRAWEYEVGDDDASSEDEDDNDTDGEQGSVKGTWQITVQSPMGEEKFGAVFDPAAGTVSVFDLANPSDSEPATGVKFQADRAKFDFHVPEPEMDVTVFLKIDFDELRGKMKTPFGDVPVRGKKIDENDEDASKPKATSGKDKDEDGTDEQEADAKDLGHPQWLVETHADRLPYSDWARTSNGTLLLRGGTLYCMDGREPFVGDLLIEDGIITAIGEHLDLPADCAEVDMQDLHLMPGIIDAHSHLALDAINEGSVSITAECRVGDMIHPQSIGIFRAAAGGTTVVQSLHGSANPIGGQAATWELNFQATAIAELLLPNAPRNIKFALGENVKQSNWASSWGKRFPNSRLGVQTVYRRAFAAAEDYAERRRLAAAGELPNFRRDVRLEVLADVLDNVVHVQCHSYRADELLMFLEICAQYGIQGPTFQHVLEGYKVAPELAAAGAMASTFSDWWAYKLEVQDAIPWNTEILHKAGVVVSINSDSDEMIRRLNTEAAKAMLYGDLSWQDAMAGCTINSAKQLRIDHLLGSLEVGKHGTVSVFDGPPLSGYSRNVFSLARGIVLFEAAQNRDEIWQQYGESVATFAAHLRELANVDEETQSKDLTDADAAPTESPAQSPATPKSAAADWSAWTANGQGLSYLIEGATIHPVVGEPFVGNVLLKDGRIAEISRGSLNTPYERRLQVEVIKARGKHLYPGFINCLDRTGIWEIGALRASRDDIETGTDHPDLSTAAAIHADSAHHHVARKTGVAYVLSRPTSGRIRGKGALIQLDGVTTPDMVVQKDIGLFLRFPRVAGFEQEDGPEIPDEVEELNRWFDDALQHGESLQRFADAERLPIDRDLRLEALLPYAQGLAPIFLEANNAATIMAARAWAQERNLQVVYVGAREAWKVAGFLGADGARVISTSTHSLPSERFAPYDSPFRNASVLRQAGCLVGLATDNPEVTRNLPFQAATEAAWGRDRAASLRSITIDAARVLGVQDFIGSIEEGKVATVFLTSGDPLLIQDPVEAMWIGGRKIELDSKQTELRERYLERLPAAQR